MNKPRGKEQKVKIQEQRKRKIHTPNQQKTTSLPSFFTFSAYTSAHFTPFSSGLTPQCCRVVRVLLQSCSRKVPFYRTILQQLCNNGRRKYPFLREKRVNMSQYVSKRVKTGQYESKRVNMCQNRSICVNVCQNRSIWVKTCQYVSRCCFSVICAIRLYR